jgi:hypothetical protein
MASSSNTSSKPRYLAVTRVDQEVMSRMILVDFTTLDMQNTSFAANEIKHFIATVAGLAPSQVNNQIAQLNKQVVTQATTIAEVRERNSALRMEGRDLVEMKTHSDKELALM